MGSTSSPHAHEVHDWREGRRLRGGELHQQGGTGCASAAALGVTSGAVRGWIKRGKHEGSEALRHRPPPGPQPKRTGSPLTQLPSRLARGAEAVGVRGEVWTTARVAAGIAREFGGADHPAHLSRRLRRIGGSRQQPIVQASQRDDAALAHWYGERWPARKKGRRPQAAPLSG
jgi:transposase